MDGWSRYGTYIFTLVSLEIVRGQQTVSFLGEGCGAVSCEEETIFVFFFLECYVMGDG